MGMCCCWWRRRARCLNASGTSQQNKVWRIDSSVPTIKRWQRGTVSARTLRILHTRLLRVVEGATTLRTSCGTRYAAQLTRRCAEGIPGIWQAAQGAATVHLPLARQFRPGAAGVEDSPRRRACRAPLLCNPNLCQRSRPFPSTHTERRCTHNHRTAACAGPRSTKHALNRSTPVYLIPH